jgi:hypothetical protein
LSEGAGIFTSISLPVRAGAVACCANAAAKKSEIKTSDSGILVNLGRNIGCVSSDRNVVMACDCGGFHLPQSLRLRKLCSQIMSATLVKMLLECNQFELKRGWPIMV